MKSTLKRFALAAVFGVTLAFLMLPAARAQSPEMIADVAARINRERISRGMIPFAVSAQLTAAAQAHANDIMRTSVESHTGSDGSTVQVRVQRVGYGTYSWICRVGENWARYYDVPTAMKMWMDSPPHYHNILHPVYREFGVGIAPYKSGGYIYVVDFGAEPNVLPVFATSDGSGQINLMLTNETYATTGDGANTIGLATQVQVAGSPDFANALWQNYATRLTWTPPAGSSVKTVYVRFRDAKGRTVTSTSSVDSGAPAIALPTLRPTATSTPRPKPTATRTSPPTPSLVGGGEGVRWRPSPTEAATLEPTATPEEKVAMVVGTPEPLPPDSAESDDAAANNSASPFAFGIVGVAVLLGVFAGVKFFTRQKTDDA